MNRYKIIFPYQSSIIHLAENETKAFDKCFIEINESGRNPDVFVVLDIDNNNPYYLEINKKSDNLDTGAIIKENVQEKSDILSKDSQSLVAESKTDNLHSTASIDFVNPIKTNDEDLTVNTQKTEMLEKRIDYLENEMIKMKMKIDYVSQLTVKKPDTNQDVSNTQDSECSIQ
jgi:hypothetical protein